MARRLVFDGPVTDADTIPASPCVPTSVFFIFMQDPLTERIVFDRDVARADCREIVKYFGCEPLVEERTCIIPRRNIPSRLLLCRLLRGNGFVTGGVESPGGDDADAARVWVEGDGDVGSLEEYESVRIDTF